MIALKKKKNYKLKGSNVLKKKIMHQYLVAVNRAQKLMKGDA